MNHRRHAAGFFRPLLVALRFVTLRFVALSLAAACAVSMAALLTPASAQADKVAEIAAYQGPDREQRLIEGGKREAALTLYSNAPTDDNAALVGAFTKKHGIKVSLWRASSEEIRQRVLAEAKAKRFEVDFILNNSPALEALRSERILQEVKSPYLADLMGAAVPPHREWIGFCLNVLVAARNTNLVKKEELPASYQELTDPKWKGRLGIEVDDFDWFAGLVGEVGEAKGVDLFRDIAATNGFSVRKGHTLLANLVAAGEVPLALTVFNYTAEQLRRKGAPIDWFALAPLISMPNSISVANTAPHPHAAVLFLDFMLSDAQKILAERDYVVTSTKVASPLDRSGLKVLDSAKILADGDKWRRLYTEVISSRK
jgi:iron(III) transport system substrate-binding protein